MLLLTKLITAIILPPFNSLILWFGSLLLYKLQFKKLSSLCSLFGIAILYVCSTPYFSHQLIQAVTFSEKLTIEDYKKAQAIVVLGGGVRNSHELFADYAIAAIPLERMRYAAYLHKQTHLPILVTGGSPENREPEAKLMAQEFRDFFNISVKWIEARSNTTEQNAILSKAILEQEGIRHIILVTNQWHMKRAKMLFEREGFSVLAASTTAHQALDIGILPFIPQAQALQNSSIALKEWIGYWKEKLIG
ncbi:YdcF family protein [Actinobacillus arthritidis]|uniref:YdcF family protein n=1 Tax=Actinobacillus arthritidis TaxID=157339 RepID=UPI002441F345|nr:YdcF family protein [Actinobacillus arthritidis]WGE90066.1 YdcF family protein [Actinobacillus arthritidis]